MLLRCLCGPRNLPRASRPSVVSRTLSGVSGICAHLLAFGAFANGVFQGVTGDVRASVGSAAPVAVFAAQRFQSRTTITTGANSRAVLRFDDGHAIVLHENTEFRLAAYRFNPDRPQEDTFAAELAKGALRSVTGLIGQRSGNRVSLSMPQATIGIRGADFMVALVNPAYVSVLKGAVGVTNAAGTVTFSAGALGTVATATTLAAPTAASALPAEASAAFSSLSSVAVGGGASAGSGGASAGATGAGASAGGGVSATVAAVAAAVAGIASAAGHDTVPANHH